MEEKKYQLNRHSEFGFLQVTPTPSPEEITQYYADEFYSSKYKMFNNSSLQVQLEDKEFNDGHREDMCETIASVTGKSLKGLSILDVGCGWGQALLYFKGKGMSCYGFDPAPEAVEYGCEQGLKVVKAGMNNMDVFGEKRFDVVTLLNVLEHLSDPVKVLRDISRSVLLPGGVIVIEVPNEFNTFQICGRKAHDLHEWWVAPPGHLNYFDRESLGKVLKGAEFEIILMEATFPMELFLLFGENYVKDGKVGKKCHQYRKAFERNLSQFGYRETLRKFYQSLAELNLGRTIMVYARTT
jgi:2-polyprenyl-3-methyl-5-hydroxy-6-metoxy-1,4-benzoquinol methylase